MSLIGTGLQAYGQYESGREAKKAADYNAEISKQQADMTRQRAALNEFKKRKEMGIVIGEQQAAYAKAGVVTTTGSPIDVMTDSIANAELDIAIDNYNNEVAARGYESEAERELEAGEAAAEEGMIGAGTTLLKGAAETAYKFGGKTKIGQGEDKRG